MNAAYENFLGTLKDEHQKIFKKMKTLPDMDVETIDREKVMQLVVDADASSHDRVSQLIVLLSRYIDFCGYHDLSLQIYSINRVELWKELALTKKKYISHDDFEAFVTDVSLKEERNVHQKIALLRCLYEGVYEKNLGVILRLRSSDVCEEAVNLSDTEGEQYNLKISTELAGLLVEISKIHVTESCNPMGIFTKPAIGLYHDSCFKFAVASGRSPSADKKYQLYNILRTLSRQYLGYNINAFDLFISGIMYRITLALRENGFTLEEAFAYYGKNQQVKAIIMDELQRCHYKVSFKSFKNMVVGHLDCFQL